MIFVGSAAEGMQEVCETFYTPDVVRGGQSVIQIKGVVRAPASKSVRLPTLTG
jgi:hypothetical protein